MIRRSSSTRRTRWPGTSKGASLYSLGRYEEAVRCFDRVLELDPRNAEVWYNNGVSLHEPRPARGGDTVLRQGPGTGPAGRCEPGTTRVSASHALGRHEDAIGCLDQGPGAGPADARGLVQQGPLASAAWAATKKPSAASTRRCELDPTPRAGLEQQGYSASTAWAGHDEAIRCYDKALELDPKDADGLVQPRSQPPRPRPLRRGDPLLRQGPGTCPASTLPPGTTGRTSSTDSATHEEAIRSYDKALELDPTARLRPGTTRPDVLDRSAATKTRSAAVTRRWNSTRRTPRPGTTGATSSTGLGRYDEAVRCFDKTLELDPKNAAAWYSKGDILNRLGRHDEAVRCL